MLLLSVSLVLVLILHHHHVLGHWPHDNVDTLTVGDDGYIFTNTNGYFLFSDDYGETFKFTRKVRTGWPITESATISSTFADDNVVYIYTKENKFCVSKDKGKSISCLFDACQKTTPYDGNAEFVASLGGVAITTDKSFNLLRSTNNAKFNKVSLGFKLSDCPALAADNENGIAYLGDTNGALYQSTDYGVSWDFRLSIPSSVRIRRVVPVGGDTLFLLGNNNKIYHVRSDDTINVITPPALKAPNIIVSGDPTKIIMISAHRVKGVTTLYVTRVNSYTSWFTRDFGKTWQTRGRGDTFLDYEGDPQAYFFGEQEISQIVPMRDRPIVYAATYSGVYRSEDSGNTWTMMDSINNFISGITVAKLPGNAFQVGLATTMLGGYSGKVVVDGTKVTSVDINPVPRGDTHDRWYFPYWLYAVSPNYKDDKTAFRFGLFRPGGYRLERSNDNFKSVFLMKPPPLSSGAATWVQDIKWDGMGGMYLCGWNLGVVASFNNGQTWTRYWNPRAWTELKNGDVLEIDLSPNFKDDGIMVALVLLEGTTAEAGVNDAGTKWIFYNDNYGKSGSWKRVDIPNRNYSSMTLMAGTSAPILVATEYAGKPKLFAVKMDDFSSFRTLNEVDFPAYGGYGSRQSLTASPDGKDFIAAFQDGSSQLGTINKKTLVVENAKFAKPNPGTANSLIFSVFYRRNSVEHHHFDCIAYSPNYASDGIIFAREFYTLYISFNRGVNWKEVHTLPHNDPISDGGGGGGSGPKTGIIMDYDFETNDFVYQDNLFGDAPNGRYSDGYWTTGVDWSQIAVRLGGVDDNAVPNMSGGHKRTYTLPRNAINVVVQFRYKVLLDATFVSGENIEVLCTINGKRYGQSGKPNNTVDKLYGADNPKSISNWKTATINLGAQNAGTTYTFAIGGLLSWKSGSEKVVRIPFDNLKMTATYY